MADQRNGGITWTEETWNPLRGCSRNSPGCLNCYAEAMAARFCGPGQPYEGTINPETKRWNGNVRLILEKLADPLRWRRSRMVFVNSMSDLFHEDVPDEFIDKVFAVMALAQQHTFQVLTKRPERMRDYCNAFSWRRVVRSCTGSDGASSILGFTLQALQHHFGMLPESTLRFEKRDVFPLPNVWLGVTVENQEAADKRREHLECLSKMGWLTWVSSEPRIGPIDWPGWEFLDWLVTGGESGANARPMHPDWPRSDRDWCELAGVPFLFKQWGGKRLTGRSLDGYEYNGYPEARP